MCIFCNSPTSYCWSWKEIWILRTVYIYIKYDNAENNLFLFFPPIISELSIQIALRLQQLALLKYNKCIIILKWNRYQWDSQLRAFCFMGNIVTLWMIQLQWSCDFLNPKKTLCPGLKLLLSIYVPCWATDQLHMEVIKLL